MKLLILIFTTIFISCASKKTPEYVQYSEINDHNDFIKWSLQGNGPIHNDKNLDKMNLDHYLIVFKTGKNLYRNGQNIQDVGLLWKKYPTDEAEIIIKDNNEIKQIIKIRINEKNRTFEII